MSNDAVWNRFITELLDKNDIVDVISSYIEVKPKGRGYWALCPFHNDRNPSLSIKRDGQYFNCFVCGSGGNCISFVMKYESCTYMEAVEKLAKRVGMEIPNRSGGEDKFFSIKKAERETHYEICREAARFYHATLMSEKGTKARKYLEKREISPSSIRRFGLGYSPDWDALGEYLCQKGYKEEDMQKAGVLNTSKKNGYYDPMGGRIIVPIVNITGNVVAFGGRVFNGEDVAKYKNTAVTDIFDKSKNLFAINLAKKCKQEGRLEYIVVVEGYMDVIALNQAGYDMTVASMGTALTADQARLISRFTKDVFICYDGDKAGQAATLRGLDILKNEGLNVRVVSLPDGMDPDDFIRKRGNEGFKKVLDTALPLTDYKIECAWRECGADKSLVGGKKREVLREFAKRSLAILKPLNSVEQDSYLRVVCERTGLAYDMLKRELIDEEPTKKSTDFAEQAAEINGFPTGEEKAFYFVLASFLTDKEYTYGVPIPSHAGEFFDLVSTYIEACKKDGKKAILGGLDQIDGMENFSSELKELRSVQFNDNSTDAKYFVECLDKIEEIRLRTQIKALQEDYETETDEGKKSNILIKIAALSARMHKKSDKN